MRFVIFLHSYFTSYHSQTFAVGKSYISALLYVAKTDLNYLSWFIFYNICCPKSKKLANIFLTILSFKAQKWFKISKKVTIFEISMTILLPVSAEKVKQKKFKQMCTFNAL